MNSAKIDHRKKELERTISKCELLLELTEKKSNKIGWVRFLVFFVGILLTVLINFTISAEFSFLFLGIVAIIFIFISTVQKKIITRIEKQKKWIEIKKSYLARITLDWGKISEPKEFEPDHLTATALDLDLTGIYSVHRLINFTKTCDGSKLLRRFLIETPVNEQEIIRRQKLVKELVRESNFRDKFLLICNLSSKTEIKSSSLLEWLKQIDRTNDLSKQLKILVPFCFASLGSMILFLSGIISLHWLFLPLIYLAFYFLNQKLFRSQAAEAEIVIDELRKIIGILEFVESANYKTDSEIRKLCLSILVKEENATSKLKRINFLLSILSFRSNPLLWFLLIMIYPMDFFIAFQIEKFKNDIRLHLPSWLSVLNNLEAFISLANYSYLHPDCIFPEIILADEKAAILFESEGLSHPLIRREKCVANNYSIFGSGRIDIFTGSNMSGKSTFLRTVGVNICLANAGAPVSATGFRMNHFRLFTCIRVSDSVVDGISYFYAEVKRLKTLLNEFDDGNSLPILFLIDEIFKGTNNIERLQGSEATIKSLANKNGAGLISTHDLELVRLAEIIPTVSNYHFKEEIVDDRMIFDYILRTGPCPTTNAIKIMRANGLPV